MPATRFRVASWLPANFLPRAFGRSGGRKGMSNSVLHLTPGRYESLDGMRGLCAVIVALLHFDFVLGTGVLVQHGWLSVDMFFVLSGFVIALKYEDRLRSGDGFRGFMSARAARLLPVQILGTIAGAIALWMLYLAGHLNFPGADSPSLGAAFLSGLLLVPLNVWQASGTFFFWQTPFPVNPPLWSLQAEWLVNIVYGRWLASARIWLLILLWTALTLYLLDHVFAGKRIWDLTRPFELIPSMERAGIGFLAGVVLYRLHRRGLLMRLPSISPRAVFAIWFLICLVPPIRMPVFESVAALIVAPLSVALLIRGERPLLKLYTVLGTLSYPLYASHSAIVYLAMIWLAPGTMHLLFLIPMLIAALLLAWGIDRLAVMLQRRARGAQRSAPALPSP